MGGREGAEAAVCRPANPTERPARARARTALLSDSGANAPRSASSAQLSSAYVHAAISGMKRSGALASADGGRKRGPPAAAACSGARAYVQRPRNGAKSISSFVATVYARLVCVRGRGVFVHARGKSDCTSAKNTNADAKRGQTAARRGGGQMWSWSERAAAAAAAAAAARISSSSGIGGGA